MRDHAVVSPLFWSGRTGQQLRKDSDAQLLALYLMTCPNSNMIGLYYLPIPTICHEIGMSEARVRKALTRGIQVGFCAYDAPSEMVWVYEMSRFQCAKTIGTTDKRKPAVKRLIASHRKSKFYTEFMKKYGSDYGLEMEEDGSPLQGGYPDAPKEKDQDKDKEQEQDKDLLDDETTTTTRRFSPPTVEQVAEYCHERKNAIDPERFVDYYTTNGWKVGKNPMRDWKAAIRTWEKNDQSRNGHSNLFAGPAAFAAEESGQ